MLLFESFKEIEAICQKYGIYNYTINRDGTIDVDDNVDLGYIKFTELPLKFREVTGHFYCNNNYLATLEGVPKSVGGSFYCDFNELITLEGAPKSVGNLFSCSGNNLTTLKGAPQSVGGSFDCNRNELTTLEYSPQSVDGNFYCYDNKLTTLKGAPQSVGGGFFCYSNPVDSIRELFPNGTIFYKLYNEWEFFAGGNKIYKHRFLEAMLDIGKKRVPEYIPGYEYI